MSLPIPPAFQIRQVRREVTSPQLAELSARYHALVTADSAVDVELGHSRLMVVLFRFDSFAAWQGYRDLEEWEREDALWTADSEYDLWQEELDTLGLLQAAQVVTDRLISECERGLRAGSESDPLDLCSEESLWSEALVEVGYNHCGGNRVGLALFSAGKEPQSNSLFQEARVFEGLRCPGETPRIFALELGGIGGPEFVVELPWRVPRVSRDTPQGRTHGETQNFELLIFSSHLELELRRRLFTRIWNPENDHRSEPLEEARFSFENVNGTEGLELIIDNFSVAISCISSDCSRLVFQNGAPLPPGLSSVSGSGCPPFRALEEETSCSATHLERRVLSFDTDSSLWL